MLWSYCITFYLDVANDDMRIGLKCYLLFNGGDDRVSVLTVDNISKKINSKTILQDVSFNLEKGEIVGLVGANGAGKTSLMKVILGYSNYQKGHYKVVDSGSKRSSIGALIESPGVYPFMSGYDNLKLLNESKDNSDIDDIVTKLKMKDYIHNKAKTYSLGMKQKLGIAIAFLNDPKLIILDEPMNGLDPRAVRDVRNLILDKAQQGITFLISSHMLSELVKITDAILIIDEGKIVKETTREEIEQHDAENFETGLLDIIDKEGDA